MQPKILIVDDEQDILEILRAALTDEGYSVQTVDQGKKAVEVLGADTFDLVLTDIKMPGLDGFDVIKHVKKHHPDTECIVMTGFATIENAVNVLRQDGAFDFITKPLAELDQLFITIHQALEKRRLRLENRQLVEQLGQANESLEARVRERTFELMEVNRRLEQEMDERKRMEEHRARREKHYRFLAENMRDVIWTADPPNRLTYASPSIFDLLGYTPEEAMEINLAELLTPESQVRAKKVAEDVLSKPFSGSVTLELEMVRKNGSTVWTEVIGSMMAYDAGRAKGFMGVSRDISERRAAQHALLEAHRDLENRVLERTKELNDTRLEIIRHLGKAAEFKDEETGFHIIRMSKMCALVGEAAGLSAEECDLLLNASPMHDIGKIGIPDHILQKQGKLTKDEWVTMQTHTIIGSELLSGDNSRLMVMAKDIALTHHEKWDGSGYPNGISKDNIPLTGRICTVCDVFDALISKRPYKEAWPVEKAVEEIKRGAGAHFDPRLVDIFIAILPSVLDQIQDYREI